MRQNLLLFISGMLLAGCTWGIVPTWASKKIHTAWNEDVSACREMGKITVSVISHLGPLVRNDIKVRDELHVMARNQAVSMHADTIKPLNEPDNGRQMWGAYACDRQRLIPDTRSVGRPVSRTGRLRTFPMGSPYGR